MRADLAIVGAGIIGCVIAREVVSRAPGTTVVVLDRDFAGAGASRRSAGLHFPRGATDRVRRMTAYSQDYYEKLKAARPDLPIHPLGMTVVARMAGEQALREVYLDEAALVPAGLPSGLKVRVPDDAGVWEARGGQYADVPALTQALAGELRAAVTFREGARVTAVEPARRDGSVTLRLGTGDAVTADRVVLAPGPWLAAPAWRDLVAPLGARVKRVVALHVELIPDEHDGAIVFHDEDAFLLPLRSRGHWLFSYTNQEWDVDPDALTGGLSPGDVEQARACLDRYAPDLAERCLGGRAFCDAYSADREPLIRELTADGRVVFAGAANGSGYRLAPAIAAEAAGLLNLPSGSRSFT